MAQDWTTGPAKWAAVGVLGAASVAGVAWSIWTSTPRIEPRIEPRGVVPVVAPERERPRLNDAGSAEPAPSAARIDLNTATAGQLEVLPGIGPALAARIVEYRTTSGPFRSVDELDEVKGIGPRILERLRPLITVE
jgi:comEA protein